MTPDLHHLVDGPADAPAVLFAPSLGTDLHLFDPQVAALAGRYRCIRVDLPGHGTSPDVQDDLTVAELARGALAAADAAGAGAVHVVGDSLGGAITQWLGVHGGDRILSVSVLASAARFPDPDSWPQRAATVRAQGTQAMVASRPGVWFTHAWGEENPEAATRLLDMLRATTSDGYAACCAAIGAFDIRADLGSVSVPALVVAGAADPATPPALLREIADAIPGARYAEIPDAAHLPGYERPDEVNVLLAEHLDAQRA